MKRRIFVALLIAGYFVAGLMAQSRGPFMSFDTDAHDFGTITEEGGPVTYRFEFTNTGGAPLIISNVTTSCGCTAPSWSKEPVLPGAKGFVSATYDPKNRPGKFEKTITVVSNAEKSPVILRISGEVTGKLPGIENMLPVKIGNLRLSSNTVSFGDLNFGNQDRKSLYVMNTGSSTVQISFSDVPKHLLVMPNPAQLKPGESGTIDITYETELKNAWGFVTDRFQLLINGKAEPLNRIVVTANIKEDFSRLSQSDMASAPVISAEKETFDFGTVKQGTKIEASYVIKNTGKRDLLIRDVQTSCGCTVAVPGDKIVKPGKSTTIKAVFNTRGYHGTQNKLVMVISNDPKTPKLTLWLRGTVEK